MADLFAGAQSQSQSQGAATVVQNEMTDKAGKRRGDLGALPPDQTPDSWQCHPQFPEALLDPALVLHSEHQMLTTLMVAVQGSGWGWCLSPTTQLPSCGAHQKLLLALSPANEPEQLMLTPQSPQPQRRLMQEHWKSEQ